MKTFTITHDANITAYSNIKFADAAVDVAAKQDSEHAVLIFETAEELSAALKTFGIDPVDLWNSIPGLTPVKKFTNRNIGIARIWKQIQSLGEPATAAKAAPAKAAKKVKAAKPAKAAKKAAKPAKPAKPAKAAKGKKAAKKAAASTGRADSKQAQAIALMSRANGATLAELMETFGWQAHTVRGFVAGALRVKLGLTIESFKTANGDRVYKVAA